ncbi:MAG: glycosyltransferase family 4 protein [Saprospiraceae bacterium]
MHIRVIRTRYPHWGAYSGINQFMNYLDQGKYSVDMHVASDSDEDFPIKNRMVRDWLRRVVQKRGMQWYKLSDLTAEVKALKQCWRKKIDILHYLDGEHSAQFLPKLPKRLGKFRPKMVATYHQPSEVLESLINRDVIAKLDCVTVVSPEQVPFFEDLLPPDKIVVILHGINTDHFRPASDRKEENKFKCITVGHYLRDFNAVQQVAEKLSVYREIEFHVVTSKPTGLENLTNVKIHGEHVDDADLLNLYQQSQILFLPLIQSTANNSLLEGLACGLPVVSTCLSSVRVYVPGRGAILIKNNDPNQFADAILHLVQSPEDRRAMAIAARKRAEELDWRNIATQYEDFYLRVTPS